MSLALVVLLTARQFALPAIFLVFFSAGSPMQFFFALFVVVPLVSGFLQHFFFHYRLGENEVVVRQGVFHRTVRHVPFSRIQNIDTSEGLLQRMLGLVQVSLETASGAEPEAQFKWVSRAEANAIRAFVLARRGVESAGAQGLRIGHEEVAIPTGADRAETTPTGPNGHRAETTPTGPHDYGTGTTPTAPDDHPTSALRTGVNGHQTHAAPAGEGVNPFGDVPHTAPAGSPEWEDDRSADASTTRNVTGDTIGERSDPSRPLRPSTSGLEALAREELHRVPLRDLVILGLFSGRGLVIFGAATGLIWEFRQLGSIDSMAPFSKPDVPRVEDYLSRVDSASAVMLVLLAVLVVGAFITLGSVLLTVSAYYGFTLTAGGRDLYVQSGLTTRQTRTIGRKRIQILESSTPPHLRWFGFTRLRAGTAGGSTGEAAGGAWLVPILRTADLDSLVRRVQSDLSLHGVSWQPPHPRAVVRQQRRALTIVAVVVIAGIAALKVPGLLLLLLAPLAWVHAGRSVRFHGHAITEHAVYARHGWISRKLEIVPFNKIQTVTIEETPFDRRWGMATIHVDTAAGGGALVIPFLSSGEATTLQRELVARAGARSFDW